MTTWRVCAESWKQRRRLSPNRSAVDQKIGDYYASCSDEKAIDAKGAEPLKPGLERIAKISSKPEIADVAAAMTDDNVLFRFDSIQDFRDANQVIADADQGGLGLPDRDYYTKDDAKSVELRKQYVAHVQKMFELLGDKPETAAAEAQTVMRIETALAKGSHDPRGTPRSEIAGPQDDQRRPAEDFSRLSLVRLLRQGRHAGAGVVERDCAELLQSNE